MGGAPRLQAQSGGPLVGFATQGTVLPNAHYKQRNITRYLVKQLKAFRDGTRVDPLMSAQAQPLSDKDIEDLAAYFSSLK